jgi:hypothetical protein
MPTLTGEEGWYSVSKITLPFAGRLATIVSEVPAPTTLTRIGFPESSVNHTGTFTELGRKFMIVIAVTHSPPTAMCGRVS